MVCVNWLCVGLECIKTGLSCVCARVCVFRCEPIHVQFASNTIQNVCKAINKQFRSVELMHSKRNCHHIAVAVVVVVFSLFITCIQYIWKTYRELCAMRLHAPVSMSRHHNYYSITIAYECYCYCANSSGDTFIESITNTLPSTFVFDVSLHFGAPRSFVNHVHCFCHFNSFKCIDLCITSNTFDS